MLDRVLDKFGTGFDAELLHDAIFVKGDSSRSDIENACDLLHGVAFSQELQDFTLPGTEFMTLDSCHRSVGHAAFHERGNIMTPLKDFQYGVDQFFGC